MSLHERYGRALRLTAPKVCAGTPGLAVDGYWLDDRRFFFLAESIHPTLSRMVSTPAIADCGTSRVQEVISLEALVRLLSARSGRPVDLAALASAVFDMPDRHTLGVTAAGWDYKVDLERGSVLSARASLTAPALYSPSGQYACYVKGHDLWLSDLTSGAHRPLTADGTQYFRYGQQPESCLAAVAYRKNPTPMGLWSPDSEWFLTHRIDERAVPELALVQHVPAEGGRPVLHRYKYPVPGDPLPVVTYLAIHVSSGRVVTFEDHPAPALIYSPLMSRARMAWFDGQGTVWALRLDRYYKNAELMRFDLERGVGRVVLSEAVSSGYFEFHHLLVATPNVRTLARTGEVIWFSERDGWGHLYLYDAATGNLKNRITGGEWLVREIVHVEASERRVLFTACGLDPQADPARRALCRINLDGTGFEVLCAHEGDIALPRTEPGGLAQDRPFCPSYAQPAVSPGGRFAAVLHGSVDRGNVTRIVDMQTRRSFEIASAVPTESFVTPQAFTGLAADGVTRLHGLLFFPSDFDERRRYPLIDYIYPGPQVTQRPQSFGLLGAAFAQSLAELGFVTAMFDTRGMPFRSRRLHQIGYGELLEPQLADHAAIVRQLCERHHFLDLGSVGIVGFSGGGFATARALLDYGETFKVGISVCGNHDNDLYISSWSDKYRGDVCDIRARQANQAVAHRLKGKLLLVSSDMDENVHVGHTLSLAASLIEANRDFDLLIVPNEGHLLLMTNGYVCRRVWDYFVRHLLGEAPPSNFEIRFEPHELTQMEKSFAKGWFFNR